MIERLTKYFLGPLIPIAAILLAVWGARHLYLGWKLSRLSYEVKAAKLRRIGDKGSPQM